MNDVPELNSEVESMLRQAGAEFEAFDHPPVYTCEEAARYLSGKGGVATKNLFLAAQKTKRWYLIVTSETTRVDLKQLAVSLGEQKLSFGSEADMQDLLGVSPGSVTVLAVINDRGHQVKVVIDRAVWSEEPLHCHPLVNTRTLLVKPKDIAALLRSTGHQVEICDLPHRNG